jgi:hypothetical protein
MAYLLQRIINTIKRKQQLGLNNSKPSFIPSANYSSQYLADDMFDRSFYLNLHITILWTEQIITSIKDESKVDYSTVLRTTNPLYNGKPFYQFCEIDGLDGYYTNSCTPYVPFNYNQVLASALKLRQPIEKLPINSLSSKGKILKFYIDITTYDGAPIANSFGFVDEADIPPIDTWFYVTKTYLYCWIPTMFIEQMQAAIDVEICDSYEWLEDINPEFNQRIFERFTNSLDSL